MTSFLMPAPRALDGEWVEEKAAEFWIDQLESTGIALAQRRITPSQRERLCLVLETIYADTVARKRDSSRRSRAK